MSLRSCLGFRAILVSSAGVIGLAAPACAQVTPVQSDPTAATAAQPVLPTDTGATSDIIVTAQRRDTKLSKTPVAITAVSSESLVQARVLSETDLHLVAPGLGVRASASSNQLNYVIRGQTIDAFSNNRPGVLPYFDEVQIGGAGVASAFYDLASVQVLKGPQGTLFGRNATGGAVLFTSQKPTDTFGGYSSVSYGNYNDEKVEGALNVPIMSDKVDLRVAGFYRSRDGYQYNLFTRSPIGNIRQFGFRGSLSVRLSDALKNDLVVDYANLKGAGNVAVISSIDPTIAPLPASLIFPGLNTELAAQRARGPFTVNIDTPTTSQNYNTIVSNITTLDLGPNLTFKNVFGYTSLLASVSVDVDGSSQGVYSFLNNVRVHQYSDEPQLLGKVGDLSFVLGGYYSYEKNVTHLGSNVLGLPPQAATPQCTVATQCNDADIRNKTYAGYAQGTYDLARFTGISGLGATVGLRYTSETVSENELPTDSFFGVVSAAGPLIGAATYQQKTYRNLSWTLGLQDQISSSTLLYVASRRSNRNGGYNSTLIPIVGLSSSGGNGYDAEKATDLELGAKFNGRIGGSPVTLNLAGYQTWIDNAQHALYGLSFGTVPIGGMPATAVFSVNVPKARVRGFELDGSIRPVNWLRLSGALNYTDAKYTNGVVRTPGATGVVSSLLGTYPDTPEWSGNFGADVTLPVSTDFEFVAHGDVYAQTSSFYTSQGQINTQATIPGYATANFRLGIESVQGWTLSANLKNAFNRVYYAGGIPAANLISINTLIPGDPRTISVELRYKF